MAICTYPIRTLLTVTEIGQVTVRPVFKGRA